MSDDWDPDPKAPPADPGWDGEKAAAGDADWGTAQKAARRVTAPSPKRKVPFAGLLIGAVVVGVVVVALSSGGTTPSASGSVGLAAGTSSPAAGRSVVASPSHRPTSAPSTSSEALDPPGEPATVIRVVDGDTIHAMLNGVDEDVRIIGLDSPETSKPGTPVECFAREATAAAKKLLKKGDPILLQPDPTQDKRDRYDRLLAHVFLADGTLFAETMIRQGDAIHYVYDGVPSIHADQLAAAEDAAKAGQVGLWSPTTCQGNAHEATKAP